MNPTVRSPLLWLAYALAAVTLVAAQLIPGWPGWLVAGGLAAVFLYALVSLTRGELLQVARATKAIAAASRDKESDPEQHPGGKSFHAAMAALSGDVARNLRRIAEERYRLELVLAAVPDGVVVLDGKGRIRQLNQVARRLLDVRDVPDSPDEPITLAECCQSPELIALLERARDPATVYQSEFALQGRILEVKATLLRTGTGMVLVVRDVSEVRRLENVRRDFVANVSHELKTPLTSIRAYVETLLDGGLEDRGNNERFLRKIDTHANRLSILLTDLLSLSRIESGRAINERARVVVAEPLRDSMQRLAPSAEDEGISITTTSPRPDVAIVGDREALQQILDNLIQNAITYSEPGGKVTVDVSESNETVTIRVIDEGIGIPAEDLPRIFERFYRVDKARSRAKGGTGLGLSIVKHYVQALGGEVHVESRADEGTTFTVRLPRA